jgi:hypothetical protein
LLAILSEPRAIWLFLSSALFPQAILLFYYNQNSAYVPVKYVLIVSVLSTLITAAVWLVAFRFFKHTLSTSVFCLLIWISIFVSSLVHTIIVDMIGNIFLFYLFWTLMSVLLAYILRKAKSSGTFSFVLCAFLSAFFVISAVSTIFITLLGFSQQKPELKTDFIVNSGLNDRPNVYWIHCDGMLSFEAVETYFGDDQDDFREALYKRDFEINEAATFKANHKTTVAVPALMCPFFYDTFLSDMINDPESDTRALEPKIQPVLTEARLKNETVNAFKAAGYNTNTVALMDQFYFPTTDAFYFPLDTAGCGHFIRCFLIQYPYTPAKLPRLSEEEAMECIHVAEANTFMLSFFRPGVQLFGFDTTSNDAIFSSYSSSAKVVDPPLSDEEIKEIFLGGTASISHAYFAQSLSQILNESTEDTPSFNLLLSLMWHDPYIFDENGMRLESFSLHDAKNYYTQHVYSAKVLINMVDMILEKDPDAVILLQADHGMNAHEEWELDFSFGEGQYNLSELRHSTMSAIRVPEKYRNGEEVYALETPLNMSRYIVNRFVGKNYEYLEGPS